MPLIEPWITYRRSKLKTLNSICRKSKCSILQLIKKFKSLLCLNKYEFHNINHILLFIYCSLKSFWKNWHKKKERSWHGPKVWYHKCHLITYCIISITICVEYWTIMTAVLKLHELYKIVKKKTWSYFLAQICMFVYWPRNGHYYY